MLTDKRLIIFSDFDGTFVKKDIGYRMFRHFSGGINGSLVDAWKSGQLSSRECLLQEAAMVEATLGEIHEFLRGFDLTPGAMEFYKMTIEQGIPFYIVSDGVDLYLEHVLRQHGLGEISCFCNRGIIEGNRLRLEFPYDNDGCPRCGTCKGARIKEILGNDRGLYNVIFIGDGLSDICAIPQADILFARGDFLNYCHSHGADAIEYDDFFDILNYLGQSGHISG